MQLFNWINARKLGGEFNVFSNICNNSLFFIILFLTLIIQVLMVQIGGKATQTQPLSAKQNCYCILFGFIELFWAIIVKLLPVSLFSCMESELQPSDDDISMNAS